MMRFKLIVWVCVLAFVASCDKTPQTFPVEYRIDVQNIWGVDTHPTDYPGSARLEPFLAVSHRPGTEVFNLTFPAMEGIKTMAESGFMVKLEEEVDILRGGDRALDRALGDRLVFFETGTVFLGFNDVHTHLTLMARIAPSPDWFISAFKVDLKPNDEWVDSIVVYTEAFDAGTDLAQTFTGDAIPATPPLPVSRITTVPLAQNGTVPPLAKITLKRIK